MSCNALRVKLAEVKSEFEGVVSKFEMMLLEKDRIELEMKNSNHVCGIRAQRMEWSPNSVKRAVENTARTCTRLGRGICC